MGRLLAYARRHHLAAAAIFLALGGTAVGDGNFSSGQAYRIDRTHPTVQTVAVHDAHSVDVTFNDASGMSSLATSPSLYTIFGAGRGSLAMHPSSIALVSGNTYRLMRQLDKAVECFDKAIALKPDYLIAFKNKATSLCWEGDVPAALAVYQEAEKNNCKLKFVASYRNAAPTNGVVKASVGLQHISPEQDLYHLYGKDNVVLFYTDRYKDQPLVVKGAGAGADVTASGVFADIIRASRS